MGISKTNKTYSSRYKTDVSVNQTSNVGFDSTTRLLVSGDGAASSMSASDDVLSVQPQNNDTTGTMLVKNASGSNILAVDTTNSKVLMGAGQVAANTQYAYFGCTSTMQLGAVAGTHYLVPFSTMAFSSAVVAFGTGANPSTSYDISENDNADDITMMLWYIPDSITVDRVSWFSGGSAATGDVINIHLLSFDIDTGNGSTGGDLSNGVVVAGGADVTSLGHENIVYQSIAPTSADVDAGKVCAVTFESDGTNSDYAINLVCKYHIR